MDEITGEGDTGNYIVYEGLTDPTLRIQTWGAGFSHLGPAGLQIRNATPSPFQLTVTPATAPDTGYNLEWASQSGKLYNLRTSTDLDQPIADWELVAGDIEATPDTNLYNVQADGPRRFYAVEEFDAPPPPPLFAADFEDDDGGFTVNTTLGSDWAWGAPASSGPGGTVNAGNDGSEKCWGTNIGSPGYYLNPTVTTLRSPVIDLTGVTGAVLSFAEALDLEAGDVAQVFLIDAGTNAEIGGAIYTATDADASIANWNGVGPIDLAAGADKQIRLEWRLSGQAASADYMGWYIDDVEVTETTTE